MTRHGCTESCAECLDFLALEIAVIDAARAWAIAPSEHRSRALIDAVRALDGGDRA